MNDAKTTWNDVRQLADEVRVKMHLAGLDAKDKWQSIQPRLAKLEEKVMRASDRAETAVALELAGMKVLLRELCDDVNKK